MTREPPKVGDMVPLTQTQVDRMLRDYYGSEQPQPVHGCICPPGANLTCCNPMCPRGNAGPPRQMIAYNTGMIK